MSKLHLFLVTYLGLHSLALPVLAHSGICLWLVSISDEGSLPKIALSDASKLASTYFSLFYRSVHVLYTEIDRQTDRQTYVSKYAPDDESLDARFTDQAVHMQSFICERQFPPFHSLCIAVPKCKVTRFSKILFLKIFMLLLMRPTCMYDKENHKCT